MSRPTKNQVFMQVAYQFSRLSTCNRGQVGCIIVRDGRIVSTGYNGAPAGMPHCTDGGVGCLPVVEVAGTQWSDEERLHRFGCQRIIHAEANALMYAARHGVVVDGATVFCTHGPCHACAKLMVAAGIRMVVFGTPYRDPRGLGLLKTASVPAVAFYDDEGEA